jgi:ribonuclease J
VRQENIFVLEDGEVLEVTAAGARVVENVPAGHIYVDGLDTWESENPVLRDRRILADEGIVVIIVTRDKASGKLARSPEVVSSGFLEPSQTAEVFQKVRQAVEGALSHGPKAHDGGFTSAKVKETAGKLLYKETGRKPMIIPVTIEV